MDDEEEAPAPVPNYVPALAQISDALTNPAAQDAIGEAAARLNDHVQQRQIADANEAAGQNFVHDLDTFKGGLTSFVKDDPTGLFAAMDTVNPVVDTVVRSIPGHEQSDDHAKTLTDHFHSELAHAAITSAAEQSEPLARSLLDHPRVAGMLPEEDRAKLGTYIDMQSDARARDHAAQEVQLAAAADKASNGAMFNYAAALHDRNTGGTKFPDGWNQALLADNSVTPADTAALRNLYTKLNTDGDATVSDPFLVHDLVSGVANGEPIVARDILGHAAAGDLRLQDALHLGSAATAGDVQAREHATGLDNLLQIGRTALMGRDGENGTAGAAAFARFVNWAVPAYQGTGPAGSNPAAENYLLAGGLYPFMPTGSDLPKPGATFGFERRPLADIFGNAKSRVGDESTLDYAVRQFGGRGTVLSNEDSLVPRERPAMPKSGEEPLQGGGGDTVIHEPNTFSDTLENYVDPSNTRGSPKQGESSRSGGGRHRNRARNT